MTTARARKLACEAYENKDYKKAIRCWVIAIKNYPMPLSDLGKDDIRLMKDKIKLCSEMINM